MGWTLKQRVSEHKREVKYQDRNFGIAVHVFQTGREIKWDAMVTHREQQ